MEINPEGVPKFEQVLMDSDEAISHTGEMHSPRRSYIGVNPDSKQRLEERFEQGSLRGEFDLDIEIVREEIVVQRRKEVEALRKTYLLI